jgi:hypothetical protein
MYAHQLTLHLTYLSKENIKVVFIATLFETMLEVREEEETLLAHPHYFNLIEENYWVEANCLCI